MARLMIHFEELISTTEYLYLAPKQNKWKLFYKNSFGQKNIKDFKDFCSAKVYADKLLKKQNIPLEISFK